MITALAFRLSPWPGALVIRSVFNKNGQDRLVALEKHIPAKPITVLSDQQYIDGNNSAKLDVYIPSSAIEKNEILPVVVWTHGGAWISGDKTDAGPYFQLLASKGFVVISLNYSLAPGSTYPTQIYQLNAAHAYIQNNADRFYLNPNMFILAGDSAGSQLSSQMATLITNQSYADETGFSPALPASDLVATVLFCGIYRMEGLVLPSATLPKLVSWGNDVAIWSYIGSRDKTDPALQEMSAYYHVDSNFPATFISGGNADSLTDFQSKPFSDKLESLGVDVTTLYYESNHQPELPHEYQFTLDNDDGQAALNKLVDFLHDLTSDN